MPYSGKFLSAYKAAKKAIEKAGSEIEIKLPDSFDAFGNKIANGESVTVTAASFDMDYSAGGNRVIEDTRIKSGAKKLLITPNDTTPNLEFISGEVYRFQDRDWLKIDANRLNPDSAGAIIYSVRVNKVV